MYTVSPGLGVAGSAAPQIDPGSPLRGGEGRKSFASGEITVDGTVVAEATVIYVVERR